MRLLQTLASYLMPIQSNFHSQDGKIVKEFNTIKYNILYSPYDGGTQFWVEGHTACHSIERGEIQKAILLEIEAHNRRPVRANSEVKLEIINLTDQKRQQKDPKLEKSRNIKVEGSIRQYKVNLPAGYDWLPKNYRGNNVQYFSISNQFGVVTWLGKVNISNIDFSSGFEITTHELSHRILSLGVPCLIEFYQLPPKISLEAHKGRASICSFLEKNARKIGGTFIEYTPVNGHWMLEIDYNGDIE